MPAHSCIHHVIAFQVSISSSRTDDSCKCEKVVFTNFLRPMVSVLTTSEKIENGENQHPWGEYYIL